MKKKRFIRFVVAGKRTENWRQYLGPEWDTASLRGIIVSAGQKRRSFSSNNKKITREVFKWFNDNIPVPRLSQKWIEQSRWGRLPVVCWWRTSAKLPLRKIQPLIRVLRSEGWVVCTLRSNNPGEIIYRDKYQVVVF